VCPTAAASAALVVKVTSVHPFAWSGTVAMIPATGVSVSLSVKRILDSSLLKQREYTKLARKMQDSAASCGVGHGTAPLLRDPRHNPDARARLVPQRYSTDEAGSIATKRHKIHTSGSSLNEVKKTGPELSHH